MAEFMGSAWHWILLAISLIIAFASANVNKLDLENQSLLGIVIGFVLGYLFGWMFGHIYFCVCSGILLGLGFGLAIRKDQ